MADKKIRIVSFSISTQNAQMLKQLSKELHISKSNILNGLLNKHLQIPQHIVRLNPTLQDNEICKIIKIRLTSKEYDTFKDVAQNLGINSVPRFIKYHILNMIYENKILDNKTLESIALTRAELNKIGVNINQIARMLNTQTKANIDSQLLTNLEKLDNKLTEISSEIKALCYNQQGIVR